MKITLSHFQKNILFWIFSLILWYLSWSPMIDNINQTFYARNGDGFRSYHVSYYHIKYDKSYWMTQAMNYPYGEHIFYTDCQPLVTNALKFISNNVVDISGQTAGIFNFLMVFSIILAVLFLYLLFQELNIPFVVSLVVANAIIYLSPQLLRMGGHFALSYPWVIPAAFYFLYKFNKHQNLKWTFFSSLLVFVVFSTHLYFVGLYAFIFFSYWVYQYYQKRNFRHSILHLSIQFLLPFALLRLILLLTDSIINRAANPWGLFVFRAFPESVFLPLWKPYGEFVTNLFKTNYISWEAYIYIGLPALVTFIILISVWIKKAMKKQYAQILRVTDNEMLNVFFWASFLALLYSFGLPYILKKSMAEYIGPLKHFRALARFAWVFFYAINIITIYLLIQKSKTWTRLWIKYGVITLVLCFLSYDAYLNSAGMASNFAYSIPAATDKENILPANKWINSIKPTDFQAILPMPFFQNGTDNFGQEDNCDIARNSFIISMKTGLPNFAELAARTSLDNSIRNFALSLEPYRKLDVMAKLDSRDVLILAAKCDALSFGEKYILKYSTKLDSSDVYNIYKISPRILASLPDSIAKNTYINVKYQKMYVENKVFSLDSIRDFVTESFDMNPSAIHYQGTGALSYKTKTCTTLWDAPVPNAKDSTEYSICFWAINVDKDYYPRTNVNIGLYKKDGSQYKDEYMNIGQKLTAIDLPWGLFEYRIKVDKATDKIRIVIWNEQLRKGELQVDELMIRPVNKDIYFINKDLIMKNNRFFSPLMAQNKTFDKL